MKKYLFFAAALVALASCSDDNFVGDNSPNLGGENGDGGAINFGLSTQNVTRGDIYGSAAADLLGNNFYVMGTKGTGTSPATEPATSPTTNLVFDNYLVHYGINTAGTTQSNTANWEYVGVTPGTAPYANYVYLSSLTPARTAGQTVKYWDYSTDQYDFYAFSTGTYAAVSGSSTASTNIGVTAMKYGSDLAGVAVAYTFDVPSVDALKSTYITDITKVLKANYGKEVQLQFKNIGSKVRFALYETVPGYAVKDVIFYQINGTKDFTDANKGTTAKLISADTYGFPHDATIAIHFPHVGNDNISKQDYDKASATVTPVTANSQKWQEFGTLHNFASTYEGNLTSGSYLGRTLPEATFAGSAAANYYQTVFPVSNPSPITLRVDYTLLSTDGSGEEIHIYGAKAVVPVTYTKWLPNYAYTYIFKISDNTNGWTDTGATKAGLFPITFDAVVAEATDANAEQTTVTTVATPSITTYQQGHTNGTDEYSKSTKGKDNVVRKLYVIAMHNEGGPEAHPVGSTYASCPHPILSSTTGLLYKVNDADATEADVMDALENRVTAIGADDVTGRNSIVLTKNSNMTYVTTIVNGPDDNPITIASDHGNAAEIDIANAGVAAGTYAFVYDYTSGSKTVTTFYQPIATVEGVTLVEGKKYIAASSITGSSVTAKDEAVNDNYIYFSETTNGTGTKTYSFVSVDGKTTLPAGLLKVLKSSLATAGTGVKAAADTFYFDVYNRNNGEYAVKVIKIVA